MLALQLSLSFLVWVASGALVARRARSSGRSHTNPAAAAGVGALLFILSAVVLVAGLFWVAQSAGPIKSGLGASTWLATTALGVLFAAGQAEAAGLVLGSLIHRQKVTEESSGPSSTSSPARPE